MSLAAPATTPSGAGGRGALAAALLAVGAATAGGAALVGPAGAVAPLGLAAALWTLAKAPLRWTTTALVAALLFLEISSDTDAVWHTPLVALGDLLAENLDRSLRIPGGKLAGLEVVVFALLAVALWRRAVGATVDRAMRRPGARVVPDVMVLFAASLAFALVHGLGTGGNLDFAIVQARPLVRVVLFYALFRQAYSGRAELRLLGTVVVAAAVFRAVLAVWISRFVQPQLAPHLLYATNHGDSVLFAVACVVLLADFFERPDRPRLAQAALLLPPILMGMVANNRRLAWVMLLAGLLVAWIAVPARRPWKRSLALAGVVAAPALALYVAVGWGSSSPAFAPVQTFHTLVDGTVDSSTYYREVENWNLAWSITRSPLLGTGFGHTYTELARGADISAIFALYNAVPHNGVLALLLFAGLFAFVGLWTAWVVGVFLAVRVSRLARDPVERVAALACLAAVLSTGLLVYGDLGFAFVQVQLLLPLSLAVLERLAVSSGAWPGPVRGMPGGARAA